MKIEINQAIVTISALPRDGEGRTVYRYNITLPCGFTHSASDLRSGCQGGDEREGLESLLAFLSAAGESFPDGENVDLFPPEVSAWASDNSDELALAALEL